LFIRSVSAFVVPHGRTRASKSLALASVRSMSTSWEWSPPLIWPDSDETKTASAPFCTTVSHGEYSSEGSYPLVARNAMRRPLRSLMELLLMTGCDFKGSRLGSTSEGYVVFEMERYLQRQWPLASQKP